MQRLKIIVNKYDTRYQAAKAFGVPQWQLERWLKYDAWVTSEGRVLKEIGRIPLNRWI